ncbi:coenzyme F420-0:L-glutamate ligase [Hansschlegelia sp.]|uniref:coenzyme F420-0:L-glutamate ligase n=1 Tax=Hansschlegelia sp. TaxID=2041892 RepID=UPI002C9A38C3|nr:coenzyme F420-0:L-glutamate ligase [Hansschlegelia sp.]HVI27076.1 coenzyme F420-0:L-glutamate ligase [Hansschlegelia sp.]
MRQAVSFFGLSDIPLVEPGDDLAGLLEAALRANDVPLMNGDVLVVAQKIVSKAEGRYRDLEGVQPTQRAVEIAQKVEKDPRIVQIVLDESREVVRAGPRVVVTEHRLGFVMANAGIDQSNIADGPAGERVLLLPQDPDAAAAELKRRLDAAFGVSTGVVINDSFGRPWRNGVVGVALGAAGVPSLIDRVGALDLFGRPMRVTEIAVADEIAAAASLLMGQAAEGVPAVLIRGLAFDAPELPASSLLRARERDMFR